MNYHVLVSSQQLELTEGNKMKSCKGNENNRHVWMLKNEIFCYFIILSLPKKSIANKNKNDFGDRFSEIFKYFLLQLSIYYLLLRVTLHNEKLFLKKTFPHPAFTCSLLTIETLEEGVKYVQS